jgi:ubiquinone biosynthesis protein COQ9
VKEKIMASSLHDTATKDLIITNLLRHVPKQGWTIEALRKAVIDAGYAEGDEFRVFSGNMDCAIEYYLAMVDRQMEARLNQIDLSSMRVKDRISTAVMVRLRLVEDHKEAVRKSLLYLAVPIRSSIAIKSLYNTVNAIWYAAGDRSTDFNFYTKRTLLAGVYSATLLYWLDDNSEDSYKTRAYLNRRLDQVMMIPKVKTQVREGISLFLKTLGCKKYNN